MIGEKTPESDAFWQLVCEEHSITASDYHCLTFGDPKYQDYSDHITELAIKGIQVNILLDIFSYLNILEISR